jgi:hypothetical protein
MELGEKDRSDRIMTKTRKTMRYGTAAAATCLALALTEPAAAIPGKAVLLQALDKVTARTVTIEAAVGQTLKFGALEIVVRACDRTPPTEPPESAVFLEIYEVKPDVPRTDLFRGWMFASSPALNALEHPVYDVWALECLSDLPVEPGPGFPVPRPKPIAPE